MTPQNLPRTEDLADALVKELNDCIESIDSGGDSGLWHEALSSEAHELIKAALDTERLRADGLEKENFQLHELLLNNCCMCQGCKHGHGGTHRWCDQHHPWGPGVVDRIQAKLEQAEKEVARMALVLEGYKVLTGMGGPVDPIKVLDVVDKKLAQLQAQVLELENALHSFQENGYSRKLCSEVLNRTHKGESR